ncbi:MAG: hypothetical protein ABJE95_39245 [Byssovorax sp.]
MLRPVFLAVLCGVAVTGCGVTYLDSYLCENPDNTHLDRSGASDPCHVRDPDPDAGTDASDAGKDPLCNGNCVPRSPSGWSEPVLLWMGAVTAPPPQCPTWAPQRYVAGHADLTSPPIACGACSCDPPAGSCALPVALTASSAICNVAGNFSTSFDPPNAWTGACTTANAIPGGKLCGGVPCTQSLTIAPVTMIEGACTPTLASLPAAPSGPPFWNTVAHTCEGESSGTCSNPGDTCAPVVPPPPDFAVCIGIAGDRTCPDEFSDKHLVFDHFDDARSCSACTCAAPSGGMCSSMISYFTDGACSAVINMETITSTAQSFCYSLPPGAALGSKSAGPLTHTPGVCPPSGGDPLGSGEPVEPTTFCCRP